MKIRERYLWKGTDMSICFHTVSGNWVEFIFNKMQCCGYEYQPHWEEWQLVIFLPSKFKGEPEWWEEKPALEYIYYNLFKPHMCSVLDFTKLVIHNPGVMGVKI